MHTVYTIGHSNHAMDAFLNLQRRYHVSAVADVRSRPYSRFAPHFAYKALKRWLPGADMFRGRGELVKEAYTLQGARIACRDESMGRPDECAGISRRLRSPSFPATGH